MRKLRVLDLFSGIGGFSLGLERAGGFETVAFCEIEEFPRKVLAKHWPGVPIHRDIRELRAEHVGPVEVICGGYPCQPFSTAGKRRGQEDDRHLWPEFNRLVAELRPTWVIGENVAGHISMGLDDVLSDLEGQGYACRTFVIPACAVDAPHRRDRVWTIGYSDSDSEPACAIHDEAQGVPDVGDAARECGNGRADIKSGGQAVQQQAGAGCFSLADAERKRGRIGDAKRENAADSWQPPGNQRYDRSRVGKWLPEPNLGRVAHGVPQRVDRLKALGNAVVPQIPEMIGRAIMEAEGMQ